MMDDDGGGRVLWLGVVGYNQGWRQEASSIEEGKNKKGKGNYVGKWEQQKQKN